MKDKQKCKSYKLKEAWTLWIWKSDVAASFNNWEQNLAKLEKVQTAEDFWDLYRKLPKASELPVNEQLFLFKRSIVPIWDDPENLDGSRITMKVEREVDSGQQCDIFWHELIAAALDGRFGWCDMYVNGVSVSSNLTSIKFTIWVRACEGVAIHWMIKLIASRLLGCNIDDMIVIKSMSKKVSRW
ncbi:Eukaryotic translation initiation factor 4E-2 [Trichinella pseudospiralis]|uniref:Eukaryotic translation initiation factor 4E-2 n=1 Tax=Trichinella pseudospiralis TaxID=6337 RepID=A0A0V1E2A5_TRIPS|nr:Eukaryotic translation initiation factor 4E-2 [Trichinella pseudospiralis]KRY67868.1 Eukaryotic translation initiation factor 4E-2 [Trichinella pseudospiralis]KRZ25149.1 Eukaryotic translation initiation factor 4E-2 [Trichinella pseudospiralis]KRZ42104.1 Eukaryotic translation initiation factor 4E-2 [Trichinella pseudospiralis]